jgi:hypothetical protein
MTNDTPNQLIAAIRDRIQDPTRATEGADFIPPKIYPTATHTQLDAAERTLHLTLPPFLRRLYTEIGNGGFGPGYGLIGVEGGALEDGCTIVELYQSFRMPEPQDPAWRWPEGLVPICHLGCAMYACTDCTTPEGAMVWFESNPREPGEPLQRFLIPVAPSLTAWLAAWLSDEDWYTAAYKQSELKQWNEENRQ